MKYYDARAFYQFRHDNRQVTIPSAILNDFIADARRKSKSDSEKNCLCYYKVDGDSVDIHSLHDIKMTEIRRGDNLTYVSKNRPKLIKAADNLGLIADSILHSHPVIKKDIAALKKGKISEDDILECYAPLSMGDFYMMGKWQDNFRGVLVVTPEQHWGPFFWFVNREDLDVTLLHPDNLVIL